MSYSNSQNLKKMHHRNYFKESILLVLVSLSSYETFRKLHPWEEIKEEKNEKEPK